MGQTMKKILIIGTKGMAGHMLYHYFEESNYDVYGIARNVAETDRIFNIDVYDVEKVKKLIQTVSFDAIVNCIGILNKDAEDHPSKAIWFNSYFPHFLEEVTRNTLTKVVHISTDCVFSGKEGGYTETSLKDGQGFYAQSKALGEIINDKDVTIRTSIIGPELNKNGIGLFHWFMSQSPEEKLQGYTNAYWTGVTTLELAKVIDAVLNQNINGLIQVVPKEKINKYDLVQIFNQIYRDGKMTIDAYGEYKVDKSLRSIRQDFNYEVPMYIQMLEQQKNWMQSHAQMYKHYNF